MNYGLPYMGSKSKICKYLCGIFPKADHFYISEYKVDDKRFREVFRIKKRSLLSADKTLNMKLEKVYVNTAGADRIRAEKVA